MFTASGLSLNNLCISLAVDMQQLEATCQLMPAADNPYSAHPMPLQIARQMEKEGRLGSAALAYEAAARVRFHYGCLHLYNRLPAWHSRL